MERIITTRLRFWLEENDKLNVFQSGFRKDRSTMDHILRLADDIHRGNFSKQSTIAVFLDLEKAYDLVWHGGLLYKMKSIGIKGNIFNFIKDFLHDRQIRVRVGNDLSSSKSLSNGTPQGSVISPLLFLIMINDIPTPNKDVKISLFADDTSTWKTHRNIN